MGDRALIVITSKNRDKFSPVIYTHFGGESVPEYIAELDGLMAGRRDDVDYAAARLVGIIHSHDVGNLSLGIWNAGRKLRRALKAEDEEFLAQYSHGDAGIILVDCSDFSWKAYAGYLAEQQATNEAMEGATE